MLSFRRTFVSKHRRAVIIILLVAKAAVASRSIGGVCDTAHPRENDEKTHKGLERRTLNVRVFRATTKKNASSFTSSSRICHRRHLSKRDSHHATMAFPKTKVDFDDDDFEGAFAGGLGAHHHHHLFEESALLKMMEFFSNEK